MVDAVDGVVGQEVPVDDVAEALVDAHAVLIDGEALRLAIDRRGIEAAVLQAALEHVALRVAEDDARHRVLQHLGNGGVVELGDVLLRSASDSAGYLAIGISLPATGDMFTVPLSMPPVPGTGSAVCTGSTGAGCGAGATTCFFFGALFFCAALGAGAAFFWMTSTGGSSEAAGGAGWGGAAPPVSCAMAGAAVRETRHNTHANADAKRITVTPPVVREVTDTTDFKSGEASLRTATVRGPRSGRRPLQTFPLTGLFFEVGRN